MEKNVRESSFKFEFSRKKCWNLLFGQKLDVCHSVLSKCFHPLLESPPAECPHKSPYDWLHFVRTRTRKTITMLLWLQGTRGLSYLYSKMEVVTNVITIIFLWELQLFNFRIKTIDREIMENGHFEMNVMLRKKVVSNKSKIVLSCHDKVSFLYIELHYKIADL